MEPIRRERWPGQRSGFTHAIRVRPEALYALRATRSFLVRVREKGRRFSSRVTRKAGDAVRRDSGPLLLTRNAERWDGPLVRGKRVFLLRVLVLFGERRALRTRSDAAPHSLTRYA